MANIDKLKSIATNDSNWISEANDRQKNKVWLRHSQRIAIKVLIYLRDKNIKQNGLAEMLGISPQQVNKIVKGKENLTLETISKLEQALGLILISTEMNTQKVSKSLPIKTKYIYFKVSTNHNLIAERKTEYEPVVENTNNYCDTQLSA